MGGVGAKNLLPLLCLESVGGWGYWMWIGVEDRNADFRLSRLRTHCVTG